MNANRIVNMAIRMIMRRLMRGGINMGIDAASKQMSKGKDSTVHPRQTNAGAQSAGQVGNSSKRAKQSLRMMRRIGRF